MATGHPNSLMRFLRGVAAAHGGGDAADGQLLHRFATRQDEAAFAALVGRHGRVVWGACRRVLRDPNDAEDAFQATFLVLARKAGSVARPELLGNWLYGVACHTAREAKARAARRRAKERQAATGPAADPASGVDWADLRPVLDEEIGRLPAKYRAPFVLCYLEGRTNEEAARLLGCPKGTVLSRLAWARERLRSRLTRRGLALSAGLAATLLALNSAPAAVPAPLVRSTVEAATLVAAGKAAAGAVPARVAALTEGVLRAMSVTRFRIAAAVLLAVVLAGGVGVATSVLRAEGEGAEPRQPATGAAAAPQAPKEEPAGDEVTLATAAPVVVRTVPEAGSDGVDPDLAEIKATFSKDMLDGDWSWVTFGKENFPKLAGKPKYLADKRTAVLPVKLDPGKTYALWLNSEKFRNFKDTDGRPAVPYLLVFKTKK
jgi:RNA polymerase sigma factor (sigma-70 family)